MHRDFLSATRSVALDDSLEGLAILLPYLLFLSAETDILLDSICQTMYLLVDAIAAISGILCVVLCAKGKKTQYIWGLINVIGYVVIAWINKYYGEVMLNILYYLPSHHLVKSIKHIVPINTTRHRDLVLIGQGVVVVEVQDADVFSCTADHVGRRGIPKAHRFVGVSRVNADAHEVSVVIHRTNTLVGSKELIRIAKKVANSVFGRYM